MRNVDAGHIWSRKTSLQHLKSCHNPIMLLIWKKVNMIDKHYARTWCLALIKPLFYRRYVDDTFVLSSDLSHANLFLNYINNKHDRTNFTMECESDNKLAFFDCKILRLQLTNKFKCCVQEGNILHIRH